MKTILKFLFLCFLIVSCKEDPLFVQKDFVANFEGNKIEDVKIGNRLDLSYTVSKIDKNNTDEIKTTFELKNIIGDFFIADKKINPKKIDHSFRKEKELHFSFVSNQVGEGQIIATTKSAKYSVSDTIQVSVLNVSHLVSVTAEIGGTVVGGGIFEQGSSVVIKAIPSEEYSFEGWYKNGVKVSADQQYTFLVLEKIALVAKFKELPKPKFTVSVSSETGGSATGGGIFEKGTQVTVYAEPKAEYSFDGWYKNGTKISGEQTYNFSVTENVTLIAKFKQKPKPKFTVSVSAETGGNVAGGGTFEQGTPVTVQATVGAEYVFEGWFKSGIKMSSEKSYTFTISEDVVLVAKFKKTEKPKFVVSVTAETGGSATGGGTFEQGHTITVRASTKNEYLFLGWYRNGIKVSGEQNFSFEVTENIVLDAKFKEKPKPTFVVSVTAETGGTVTGGGQYEQGTSITVKAMSNSYYSFEGWYKNGSKVSREENYTFTVTESVAFVAKFKELPKPKFTVSVSVETGGSATGGGTFEQGTSATVRATVNSGYTFDGWYKSGSKVSGELNYSFTVTENVTLIAKFKELSKSKFTVSVSAETGGSATGAGTFEQGTSATVRVTVNSGYTFDGWYKSGSKVSGELNYSFTVTENVTLIAKFKELPKSKFMVSVSAETGGSATGAGTFEQGTSATVRVTVNSGYTFDGWYKSGSKVSGELNYSFTVTENVTLIAKFKELPKSKFMVSVSAETGGSATGGGAFEQGSSATVRATVNTDYTFDGWYKNDFKVSGELNYSFTITENVTLIAKFNKKEAPKFTLKYELDNPQSGKIQCAPDKNTLDKGDAVLFEFIPNTGYKIKHWIKNGIVVTSPKLLFNISENTVVKAVTEKITYTVKYIGSVNGKDPKEFITDAPKTANYNDEITLVLFEYYYSEENHGIHEHEEDVERVWKLENAEVISKKDKSPTLKGNRKNYPREYCKDVEYKIKITDNAVIYISNQKRFD